MFHVKLLINLIADVCKFFSDTFRTPVSTLLCRKLFEEMLMKNQITPFALNPAISSSVYPNSNSTS